MGISTHILDTSRGRPGAGVALELDRLGPSPERVGQGQTDADGRWRLTLPEGQALVAGAYRLRFLVDPYLTATHGASFYPEVVIHFRVERPEEHFHVPLLLSPFGYSTYRGS
jgi:5-hydroxyisourate hydrolase